MDRWVEWGAGAPLGLSGWGRAPGLELELVVGAGVPNKEEVLINVCVSQFSVPVTRYLRKSTKGRKNVFLVHGSRGLSPWLLGPLLWAVLRQTMVASM